MQTEESIVISGSEVVEGELVDGDAPLEILTEIGGEPIHEISDYQDRLRLLIFGPTGAGKTYISATAAEIEEMCPILFLAVEGGMKTVQTCVRERGIPPERIFYIEPSERRAKNGEVIRTRWAHVEQIYNKLIATGGGGFKTIVIDSLSECYELCMKAWLDLQIRYNPERDEDLPGAAGGKDDFGRDWNKARAVMRRMVRGFRDVGLHIIMTSHSEEVADKQNKNLILSMPSFPGKLRNELPGFIDEAYYIWTRDTGKMIESDSGKIPEVERKMQCQPSNMRPACKSRAGAPILMVNPTIKGIVAATRIPL